MGKASANKFRSRKRNKRSKINKASALRRQSKEGEANDLLRDVVEKYKNSDNSTYIPQWDSVRNSLYRIRYMANEQKEADLEKKAEKDNREIDESLFEPEITIKEEVLDEPPQVTITGSAGATSWSDETASNRPLMMPDVMCTACPTISTMTYTMCPALPAQSSLSQLSSLVTRTNPHASYSEYPVYSNSPSTSSTFHNQPHVMNVQMPVITQVVGSAETITSLPEKRDDSSGDRPRDQFDAYGEYIASKLRQLDWKSCACVQKAIGDLLFEAEMGKFKN